MNEFMTESTANCLKFIARNVRMMREWSNARKQVQINENSSTIEFMQRVFLHFNIPPVIFCTHPNISFLCRSIYSIKSIVYWRMFPGKYGNTSDALFVSFDVSSFIPFDSLFIFVTPVQQLSFLAHNIRNATEISFHPFWNAFYILPFTLL